MLVHLAKFRQRHIRRAQIPRGDLSYVFYQTATCTSVLNISFGTISHTITCAGNARVPIHILHTNHLRRLCSDHISRNQ